MKSSINLPRHLERKGLHPRKPYLATVIDNRDPAELGRIRARIKGFFDHVPDDKLPWSIPKWRHPQGLKGGDATDRTGTACIPKRDNKIALFFPHDGDPMQSEYSTELPWDTENQLPEFLENYPDRLGTKLDNGYTNIIDTKTNEIFIINPGDANVTILGDTNIQTIGNLQWHVASDTGKIPSYLLDAPATVLSQLEANPQKQISFEGLYGGESGNVHFAVDNHFTVKTGGDMKFDVGGKMEHKTGGKYDIKAGGNYKVKAPRIDLN